MLNVDTITDIMDAHDLKNAADSMTEGHRDDIKQGSPSIPYSSPSTHILHDQGLRWLFAWANSSCLLLGHVHDEGTLRTVELETLGLAQETERDIGPIDIICVGWNICNSWAGVAATLALTIAQGGSVTLIYGIVVCFLMVGCSGLTMAELASVYPTAGGQ